MSTHSNLSKLELHEAFHYVQEADPGAVGANLYWLKVSTGVLKRRNGLNNAWIDIGGSAGVSTFLSLTDTPSSYSGQALRIVRVNAGGTGLEFVTPTTTLPTWLDTHPDRSPASPGLLDDEFPGSTLDVKWTWQNQGTATTTVGQSRLGLKILAASGVNMKSLLQTLPAAPWTVTAQITLNSETPADFLKGGLVLRDSSAKLFFYGLQHVSGFVLGLTKFTNDTTFSANVDSHTAIHNSVYLKIEDNNTNLIFSFSYDGQNFMQQYSESRTAFFASGPTQIGISGATENTGTDIVIGSDWFRIV